MATKFLQLDEAAKLLGVTPDELSEMRLSSQVYGYRDGGSWKFKQDDIERLKEERAASGQKPLSGETAQEDFLPAVNDTSEDDDMILLSEVELGESGIGPASTVIGEEVKTVRPGDSDLKLGGDSSPAMASDIGLGSDIHLVGAAGSGIQNSDVELAPIDDDVLSGSAKEMPSDLSESATVLKSASDLSLGESALISGAGLSDLSGARPRPGVPDPGESSLLLAGEPSDLAMGSGSTPGDSSLHLADDDVLGGSGSGSDITHRPSESGILLIDPSDSGLSLESPPDLSTGSDPMLETTNFTVDEGSGVKADDDFLLTPLEEAGEDDSDSGSQVIMLDTEGEVDEATATLLASQIPGLTNSMLVEEESPLGGGLGGLGGVEAEPAMARRGPASAAAGPVVYASPEVPFSVLSVLGLALCTIALALCGIMMYDVVRNMWSWDSPYQVDSVIIKQFKF